MTTVQSATGRAAPEERPGRIDAVPVRHPGRWIAVAVIVVLAAMFVHMLITNKAFNWPFVVQAMEQQPVIQGLFQGTVLATVASMAVGIVGGVGLAVMRLSPNPILRSVSWLFTWFFRAIPRLVLLTIIGALGLLYPRIEFGVPFDFLFGGHLRFTSIDSNVLGTSIIGGIVGLGLSEAAYMAEIARAGILSVESGQGEAAQALGMSRGLAMRRIVLPQAMRVILPPTGNETIAMLKDTSLLIGIPVSVELFFQLKGIGARTFQIFPTYVAATLYYLLLTSILMIGQYLLERRFGRGFGPRGPARPIATGVPSTAPTPGEIA